jgi:hypothetical protein
MFLNLIRSALRLSRALLNDFMKLIEHIRRALRDGLTTHTYDVSSDTDEGWTEEDRKRMLEFFGTSTGQKLNARLRNYVFLTAIKSTSQPQNAERHNGIAFGVRMTVNFLQEQMISASHPRNDGTSETESSSSVEADLALN